MISPTVCNCNIVYTKHQQIISDAITLIKSISIVDPWQLIRWFCFCLYPQIRVTMILTRIPMFDAKLPQSVVASVVNRSLTAKPIILLYSCRKDMHLRNKLINWQSIKCKIIIKLWIYVISLCILYTYIYIIKLLLNYY